METPQSRSGEELQWIARPFWRFLSNNEDLSIQRVPPKNKKSELPLMKFALCLNIYF